jgi:hypothetical protein
MSLTDTEAKTYTGGCLCRMIRYTATGPTDGFPHLCSCEHCQKLSGGPVMSWAGFQVSNFAWDGLGGEPKWCYTFPGETKRGFCPQCGSSLAGLDDGGTIMGVTISSLDDPNQPEFAPIHQSFARNAVLWLPAIPSQLDETSTV